MPIPQADAHAGLHLLLTELWRPGCKIVVFSSTPDASVLTQALFENLDTLPDDFGVLMRGMLSRVSAVNVSPNAFSIGFGNNSSGVLFHRQHDPLLGVFRVKPAHPIITNT